MNLDFFFRLLNWSEVLLVHAGRKRGQSRDLAGWRVLLGWHPVPVPGADRPSGPNPELWLQGGAHGRGFCDPQYHPPTFGPPPSCGGLRLERRGETAGITASLSPRLPAGGGGIRRLLCCCSPSRQPASLEPPCPSVPMSVSPQQVPLAQTLCPSPHGMEEERLVYWVGEHFCLGSKSPCD